MTKQRTSQGYRVSVLKRVSNLVRYRKYVEAEAFIEGDEFVSALSGMKPYDRRVTLRQVAKIIRDLGLMPPPFTPPGTVRVSWDGEAVEKLRAIAARHGLRPGLDPVLAREMGRPLTAVMTARLRFIGRVRPAQPGRKPRRRGPAGGFQRPAVSGADLTQPTAC